MIDDVGTILRETAARYILPRFQRLEAAHVSEKSPGDLVTIADIEAERALSARLKELLPGSVVVGEEAVARDRNVLNRLTSGDQVWIIDPIDGTSNFVSGVGLFVTLVALVRKGRIVASWIYDPINDRLATAELGQGAWCGGRQLRVASSGIPAEPAIIYGNRQLVRRLAGQQSPIKAAFSFRSTGLEYLSLAEGRSSFALYNYLQPWDHAAGYLLHAEAGGYGRRLDGSDYVPEMAGGGLLLAPDAESWKAVRALLPS